MAAAVHLTNQQIGQKIFVDEDWRSWTTELFLENLEDLDLNSIPGSCVIKHLGSTNREVFAWDPITHTFDFDRTKLVFDVVRSRMEQLISGDLVSDPLYVFIKPEPHKIPKLEAGRLRLISAVSLIDTFIDRILFSRIVSKLTSNLGTTPIAVGWSPVVSAQALYAKLGHHSKWLMADKSHWDWSFPGWLADQVERVILSCVSMAPDWYVRAVKLRFKALFLEARFEFQDGMILYQQSHGIMKSGCFMTIWFNSIAQLILHNYVSIQMNLPETPFWCFGDDTIQALEEHLIDEYISRLRDCGFVVRYSVASVPEFCGFHVPKYHHIPAYEQKHIFALRHLTLDPQDAESTLRSYQLLYANHPRWLFELRKLIKKRNLPTALFNDHIMAMIQNQ